MTVTGLGATMTAVGVLLLCFSRYLGPLQARFHNNYLGTAFTERGERVWTWSYYIVGFALILGGIVVMVAGQV